MVHERQKKQGWNFLIARVNSQPCMKCLANILKTELYAISNLDLLRQLRSICHANTLHHKKYLIN